MMQLKMLRRYVVLLLLIIHTLLASVYDELQGKRYTFNGHFIHYGSGAYDWL